MDGSKGSGGDRMNKLLGLLVMVVALSFMGVPMAMAADETPTTVQKDGDKDKDKKHRGHHRHHRKHHHRRHHKHTDADKDKDKSGTKS